MVSAVNLAISVCMINCNSSCPFSPLAEAVISPIGLSENTVVDTHHLIAFLSPLGILKTYSGVQMTIPSAFSILCLNVIIASGVLLTESSGSKCGSVLRPLKTFSSKKSFVSFVKLSMSFWLDEFSLALPFITNIFFHRIK